MNPANLLLIKNNTFSNEDEINQSKGSDSNSRSDSSMEMVIGSKQWLHCILMFIVNYFVADNGFDPQLHTCCLLSYWTKS